ncbi:hypothetical protein ACIQPS_36345 [Streptomyces sp. NPDC091290]|uniref:hypothetical protein n=1 Tax=Streptomyces sp. NPDC091290 TaxID=3365990 RepID=UPI0037F20F37
MALMLTGCGGDGGGSRVPSAKCGGPATLPGGSAVQGGGDDVAAYVQAQRGYVKCLRENGVDAPYPDTKGHIDFGDRRALKPDAKFRTAQDRCADYVKAVPESIEKGNQPKLTDEQIKVKQRYAKCMRENGAADFPDPGPDGLGSGDCDQNSTDAGRATRICGPIVGVPAKPWAGQGLIVGDAVRNIDDEPQTATELPRGGPGQGRKRRAALVVCAVAVAAAAVVGTLGLGGEGDEGLSAPARAGSLVSVTRATLTERTRMNGQLGYGTEMSLPVKGTGTVTWLPQTGTTAERGETLLRVDDRPVTLLYGPLPHVPRPGTDRHGVGGTNRVRGCDRAPWRSDGRRHGCRRAAAG